MSDYVDIYNLISKAIINKKYKIVGVNGVDTSGKSIFSEILKNRINKTCFNAQVLSIDNFLNRKDIRYRDTDQVQGYIKDAFDLNKLLDEILIPMRNGCEINQNIEFLDIESDTYIAKRVVISSKDILIIEGVLLFREPIVNYFDYKIFLEISNEEVIKRAKLRDIHLFGEEEFIERRYREKYIPVHEWYVKNHNPRGQSDIIVNNEDYNNPIIVKGP